MAKLSRNAPCPCNSGKKYKRCCLRADEQAARERHVEPPTGWTVAYDEIDELSNRVPELVRAGRLDEAEAVCHELARRFPDQIDGIDRLAEVYEARGWAQQAAEQYRKAAAFAASHDGFEQASIHRMLADAARLDPQP
jgi:tetratricopeptide (TPR) repeat protein